MGPHRTIQNCAGKNIHRLCSLADPLTAGAGAGRDLPVEDRPESGRGYQRSPPAVARSARA